MAYLSELLGRPVSDIEGRPVGFLKDLVAAPLGNLPHPVIEAIVVQHRREQLIIPFSTVIVLFSAAIPLNCRLDQLPTYEIKPKDIRLCEDVLDKQIIDTDGARVVRVNDLELVRVTGTILVGNADIGGMGILRRVGISKPVEKAARFLKIRVPDNCISWDNMELLHDRSMRLRVTADRVADLHPADIAEIISDLSRLESQEFLDSLNVKQLADTLEEIEPELQASLVRQMSDEKVADVLEEMGPDEAADLLAELSPERSEDLLELMEKDEAADVRKLLKYPEDTAGGIMTTEFAAVKGDWTAAQAIQALRDEQEEAETLFYVYVLDEQGCLGGVFSLSRLIFAQPDAKIADIMQKRIITIHPLDSQDETAQMIAKYDLLALPVVDEKGILHGIVTADDALDKIIPTAWKKRLPRFYR